MTEPKKKTFSLNDITINFRWVLPIMLGGYFIAYNHDREIQQQQFKDIKGSQDKIWNVLDSSNQRTEDRFAYVYQQCCKNASAPVIR